MKILHIQWTEQQQGTRLPKSEDQGPERMYDAIKYSKAHIPYIAQGNLTTTS